MVRTLSVLLLLLALLPAPAAETQPVEKTPRTGLAHADLASFDEMMERFLRDHDVPGGALAVAKDGRLVYARGFGYADPTAKTRVEPRSLFRVASISKPITAAAILRLVELGKLRLEDPAFDLLKLEPLPGAEPDPRLKQITVRQLLQHTAGFDRAHSFDPMFRPLVIARAVGTEPPAGPEAIIRYMLGRKLDFAPGSRHAYSNFGYCVLGRLIEQRSGKSYGAFVRETIVEPLHLANTRLGKTLARADGEVKYVDLQGRTARAVVGPDRGKPVPLPYGSWYLEAMDAHGGWLSSAPDLVRFATAFDRPEQCPILKADSIRTLFARPSGPAGLNKKGRPRDVYYGCGWQVHVVDKDRMNTWHNGALDGTASLLVRRHDGLCWAVLFNTMETASGEYLGALIDPLLHQAADRVKHWPARDLFKQRG